MSSPDEKRDYFRVAASLCVYLEPTDAARSPKAEATDWFPYLKAPPWLDEFQALQRELQREIAGFTKDTASALKKLERQNELLAGALVRNQAPPGLTITNISEGGLSFQSDLAYASGQRLAMALILNNRALPLYCYGQVLRVTPTDTPDGHMHQVAVGFVDIDASDRDSLARQVLQSQQKRGSQS